MNGNNNQPTIIQVPMPDWGGGMIHDRSMLNEVPARVKVAMDYLAMMTFKVMPRCAVNDVGFNELDALKLTTAEENAQSAAANMLLDYFQGDLKANTMEKLMVEQEKAVAKKKGENAKETKILICPRCGERPQLRSNCPICEGSGQVAISRF